jgi:hypothetical protein
MRGEAQATAVPPVVSELYASISASYFTLRRGLAILALIFPVALVVGAGAGHLQASISAYYHFSIAHPQTYGAGAMRDVFVGVLWAIGAFLFFYRGYSTREDRALDVAGVAAVLIATVPMDWPARSLAEPSVRAMIHTAASVIFFLAIAYVCLFRPGDTLALVRDATRRQRFKRGYALLGALMVAIPLGLVALHYVFPVAADHNRLVFFVEAAAIYVFSAFWLVKSREIAAIEKQPPLP